MKYEIRNQRYTINDDLSSNALVVGFVKKVTIEEMLNNLDSIKKLVPILTSVLSKDKDGYFFDVEKEGWSYTIEQCANVNSWLTKQFNSPLNLEKGEFLRLAVYKENTLLIFAHNIISDSRGLVNFAKAILLGVDNYIFDYKSEEKKEINFLTKLKAKKFKKLDDTDSVDNQVTKVKVKKVSLKSDIVFMLCSSNGVSLLSFFIAIALSLNKVERKSLMIPFCYKEFNDIVLVNDSANIKFKRGLEPRLKFYENCREIDKLFNSFVKRKPYLKRSEVLKRVSEKVIDKPFSNKTYNKFLSSDLYFDVIPTIEEDEILTTMSFYPSSSFVPNSFGISVIDDKITICSVLHDQEGEEFYKMYQQTINLLAKNADYKFT